MRDLAILFIHLLTTMAKLMRPDGGRAAVARNSLQDYELKMVIEMAKEMIASNPACCNAI